MWVADVHGQPQTQEGPNKMLVVHLCLFVRSLLPPQSILYVVSNRPSEIASYLYEQRRLTGHSTNSWLINEYCCHRLGLKIETLARI